jgi:hypothetical protein
MLNKRSCVALGIGMMGFVLFGVTFAVDGEKGPKPSAATEDPLSIIGGSCFKHRPKIFRSGLITKLFGSKANEERPVSMSSCSSLSLTESSGSSVPISKEKMSPSEKRANRLLLVGLGLSDGALDYFYSNSSDKSLLTSSSSPNLSS